MKIRANAKINLNLRVCGKREDGYHLIDTVMHSVSLFDELEIKKADKISVVCDNAQIEGESNIAYRAAESFFEYTGISGGAEIIIKKHIPTAAGLGGGSADAAAVLVSLDRLYATELSHEALCSVAVKLGADVPFFIKGGCQRAEGIGEILTPEPTLKKGCILLAKADKKPSTGEMYKKIDSIEPITADSQKLLNAVINNDLKELSKHLKNAFAEVWSESSVKQQLLNTEPLAVSLSGSGPTWFALFENEADAEKALRDLKRKNINCWLVSPTDKAIIFE